MLYLLGFAVLAIILFMYTRGPAHVPKKWLRVDGVDYQDGSAVDLGLTETQNQCELACSQREDCRSYTWYDSSNPLKAKQCFGMKNTSAKKDQNNNLHSGVLVAVGDTEPDLGNHFTPKKIITSTPGVAHGPAKKFMVGPSNPGNYMYIGKPSEQECRKECNHNRLCEAYTWFNNSNTVTPNGCYLYDRVTPTIADNTATSGVVTWSEPVITETFVGGPYDNTY